MLQKTIISLFDLQAYLQSHQQVSLWEIAKHFSKEAPFIESMLQYWVDKGCVRISMKTARCGQQCAGCPSKVIACYTWIA